MEDAEHRQVVGLGQALQQAHDVLGRLGIEARHRLIGEERARPLGKRAGDGDALGLAAGKRAGALSGKVDQPDLVEIVHGERQLTGGQAAEGCPPIGVVAERAAGDIGDHAAAPDEAGMLGDHRERHPRPAELLAGEPGQLRAIDPDLAPRGGERPGDAAQEGRLPAAVAAQHDDELAGLHVEIDIAQRLLAIRIAETELGNLQQDFDPPSPVFLNRAC
jgi:hypothetical protein